MNQKIPVFSVGMENLETAIADFGESSIEYLISKFSFYRNKKPFQGEKSSVWTINQGENSIDKLGYDLSPRLQNGKGWLYVRFNGSVEDWKGRLVDQSYAQIIQSTDMGFLVKESFDYADVWMHSLSSGKPISGAEILSYDIESTAGKCRTDVSGYCRLKKSTKGTNWNNQIYYVAKKGDDKAFLTNRNQKLYMGSISPNFSNNASLPSLSGQIIFDRKLYRPGENVSIKAFASVRKNGRLKTGPESLGKIKILIRNSRGEEISSQSKRPSAQGGIDTEISIPEDSPTGHYSVVISSEDLEDYRKKTKQYIQNSIHETFQVEEFRPVKFSVNAHGMKDSHTGKKLPVTIEGKYLFGAPMMDAPYRYTVNRKPENLYLSNFSDYIFGDQDYGDVWEPVTWSYYSGGNGKLNKAGKASISIPLDDFKPQGFKKDQLSRMYKIELESRVTDVDDKTVTNRKSITVYPGNIIPGISVKDRYQSKDKLFQFKMISISPKTRLPVAAGAQIIIHQKIWKTVHVKGASNTVQRKNTLIRKEVLRKNIRISKEGAPFQFKTPEAGNYTITVRENGGKSYSRTNFYSYGGGYIGWDFPDDDSLTLMPDKTEYMPGDTAKILIQSPYKKSTAIVTVEREGVLSQKSYEIIGNGNPVEIPIRAEYVPNVYVGVVLIRPRTGGKTISRSDRDDLGRPQLKAGVVRLNVNTSSKILPLKIKTDRKTYMPGEEVAVTIKTLPGAEIALSIADRAVLDLISYSYSDPIGKFYNNWPHGVQILENRRSLIKQMSYSNKGNSPGGKGWAAEKEKGGGFEDDSEDGIRKDFRFTAYWNPKITADAQGKAHFRFRLPHNLTTFRVQALGAKDGKYGRTVQEFQVKQPVLIQTVTPRFIRPGDIIQLGAVVVNQTEKKTVFEVRLSSEMLAVSGALNLKKVSVEPGRSKEVAFNVKVNEKKYAEIYRKHKENLLRNQNLTEYNEKLTKNIKAKGIFSVKPVSTEHFTGAGKMYLSSLKDKVKFEFPVFEQPVYEAFTISGHTDSKAEEMLKIPDNKLISPYSGSLELLVSSTALTGLDQGFRFYQSNPYFCLEQKGSAFLLTMTAGELLKSFNLKPPEGKSYDFFTIENVFLSSLGEHQNSDGGFSLWKESTYRVSNPYLTAYVVFILQTIREANEKYGKNYNFPDNNYSRAVRYLKNYIKRPSRDSKKYSLETLVYIHYLLAREKDYDIAREKLLADHMDELSLRGQVYLALSTSMRKDISNYKKNIITKKVMISLKNRMVFNTQKIHFNEPVYESYMRTFYSEGVTVSAVLRFLMKLDRANPLIPQIVKGVVSQNNNRYWYDSHSTGNLAYALWIYRNHYENTKGSFNASVSLDQKNLLLKKLTSESLPQVSHSSSMNDIFSMGRANTNKPLRFSVQKGKGRLYYTGMLKYTLKNPSAKPKDEGIEVEREIFSTEGNGIEKNQTAKSFKRGGIYLVRLRVVNPKPVYNFVMNEYLPSNMEIVNTEFKTESSSLDRFLQKKNKGSGYWWEYYDTIHEYRDDRYIVKTDYLSPGIHEYYYISRGLVKGVSFQPPAQAFGMYEPEIFGRTSSGNHSVR
ncbi:MAG: MG2 domain-containing protein [Spirochaetia bacterium]|nr:MG2 domain-containing protein [Spirochaetia bacterium]